MPLTVESFVLTRDPIDTSGGSHVLPIVARDSIFLVRSYPVRLEFGVYLEISAEPTDSGRFELRFDFQPGTHAPRTFRTKTWEVPPTSDGWSLPRTMVWPIGIDFLVMGDVDVGLSVHADDDFVADKFLTVCRCDVPDGPPAA